MNDFHLSLHRYDLGNTYSNGEFRVEGMLFGESMEPMSRGLSKDMSLSEILAKKVYGKTAIPTGTYEIEWRVSPSLKDRYYAKKYGGMFPYLKDVPGWKDVMIHPFNRGTESKGCIAVGLKYKPGYILKATDSYCDLMDYYLVPAFMRGQKVYITITE